MNLHIALDRYSDQIHQMATNETWRLAQVSDINDYKCASKTTLGCHYRGKKLRFFIFGDYELLCRLYGLSGASGLSSLHVLTPPFCD